MPARRAPRPGREPVGEHDDHRRPRPQRGGGRDPRAHVGAASAGEPDLAARVTRRTACTAVSTASTRHLRRAQPGAAQHCPRPRRARGRAARRASIRRCRRRSRPRGPAAARWAARCRRLQVRAARRAAGSCSRPCRRTAATALRTSAASTRRQSIRDGSTDSAQRSQPPATVPGSRAAWPVDLGGDAEAQQLRPARIESPWRAVAGPIAARRRPSRSPSAAARRRVLVVVLGELAGLAAERSGRSRRGAGTNVGRGRR